MKLTMFSNPAMVGSMLPRAMTGGLELEADNFDIVNVDQERLSLKKSYWEETRASSRSRSEVWKLEIR